MDKPKEQLCFITIVFPFTSDTEVVATKTKVSDALKELPKVKLELRLTELRDGDNSAVL